MAILTGFPPSNTISPSVRIAEKDLSFYSPQQSFHRAGLVGFASKGPINIPTVVSTQRQLNTIFGYPHPESGDPYLVYAAQAYLLVANELYVVRVAQEENVDFEQANTASIEIPTAGGPYVFANDSFLRYRLNGVLHVKTLTVLAGTYTTDQLVQDLNSQINPTSDGLVFANAGGKISVSTTFAYGPNATLEFVSVYNAVYGGAPVGTTPSACDPTPTNVTGWGQAMTVASLTGTAAKYGAYASPGSYDLTGLVPANLTLNVVVDGTDNVLVDNTVQVVTLSTLAAGPNTIAAVVTALNDQKVSNGGTLPGGWEFFVCGNNLGLRTLHYGRDARLRVKADSTAAGIFGIVDYTFAGDSPLGVSGSSGISTYGQVYGDSNSVDATTFTILADTAGIDGNSTSVVVKNNVREGTFGIEVYNNGAQMESWGGLTKDQASSYYVETFISLVSDWIRVQDDTTNPAPPLNGTYHLTGGSDGIPADPDTQDMLLVGNQLGFTGLYALSEPEQIDIDLIAIPGHASTNIVLAMLDFAQNKRQDCLAIIDPPFGLTVEEVVAWQNGTHPLNTTRFDSDFGALYWPWVKIRDLFNNVDVWAPPSGSVMATIARSDFLAAPWFAPAGTTRGIVPGITDVFSRPTLADRDIMYGNRNAVNCIVQFVDVNGFLVWGQKTLQRTPTALDRVNVRRMLFVAEKRIRAASRQLLFEPNDDALRAKFVRLATGILSDIQIGRGIVDFVVKCDKELNTNEVIDRNELRAQIGVQPTKAAEFIFIEFVINNTGVNDLPSF
jgi:hypothetical protein